VVGNLKGVVRINPEQALQVAWMCYCEAVVSEKQYPRYVYANIETLHYRHAVV
jgi:hypothetical protein